LAIFAFLPMAACADKYICPNSLDAIIRNFLDRTGTTIQVFLLRFYACSGTSERNTSWFKRHSHLKTYAGGYDDHNNRALGRKKLVRKKR